MAMEVFKWRGRSPSHERTQYTSRLTPLRTTRIIFLNFPNRITGLTVLPVFAAIERDGATGCSIDGTDATGTFEIVGTTADLAISAIAGTLKGLFATAATGLFSLLADPTSIRPISQRTVTAEAGDLVGLLIAFLNELLFLHESEDWLMASVSITTVSPTRIEAVMAGETIDSTRHQIQRHVKAVTYHRASVRRTSRGWEATVIVDV